MIFIFGFYFRVLSVSVVFVEFVFCYEFCPLGTIFEVFKTGVELFEKLCVLFSDGKAVFFTGIDCAEVFEVSVFDCLDEAGCVIDEGLYLSFLESRESALEVVVGFESVLFQDSDTDQKSGERFRSPSMNLK